MALATAWGQSDGWKCVLKKRIEGEGVAEETKHKPLCKNAFSSRIGGPCKASATRPYKAYGRAISLGKNPLIAAISGMVLA